MPGWVDGTKGVCIMLMDTYSYASNFIVSQYIYIHMYIYITLQSYYKYEFIAGQRGSTFLLVSMTAMTGTKSWQRAPRQLGPNKALTAGIFHGMHPKKIMDLNKYSHRIQLQRCYSRTSRPSVSHQQDQQILPLASWGDTPWFETNASFSSVVFFIKMWYPKIRT